MISRLFITIPKNGQNPYWSDITTALIRPEIALPETVLATASAVVDINPSTANTVVGWSNVIWGGIKLELFFVDPTKSPLTNAFLLSTVATNGVNAVYRLWYAKKTDSVKK